MNILYTLNDKFVPQVAAGIHSILENNKDMNNINFYLISMGITSINKQKLRKMVKEYKGRTIKILELKDLKEYFDFEFDTLGWNKVILARILMGRILPSSVKKIIYLDGDTIVRGSLEELWKMDLTHHTLGMSIEPTVDKKRKKQLGLDNYNYYNSGVLLVDLDRWRKIRADEKIINFYREKGGVLFAADQDAINGALKDEIMVISPKYNFYNIFYQYPYKFLSKLMLPLEYISKDIFSDAVNNPTIIHYLGEERPWRVGNKHKYKYDYIKNLNMTPWKNQGMENGWRLYFVVWNFFNIITKPFPFIRYNIINKLIPFFMKYRAKKVSKERK